MFKFNFQVETNDDDNDVQNCITDEERERSVSNEECIRPTEEHSLTYEHLNGLEALKNIKIEEIDWVDDLIIKYVSSEVTNQKIEGDHNKSNENSDLIPSIYEGGFKIWECTWDLIKHIKENSSEFKNKRVLELGCGSGLLGIATALVGASHVTLQDYNKEVIQEWTIPNVLLNIDNILPNNIENKRVISELNSMYSFYSGDWGSLNHLLMSDEANIHQYDYILTSETIYNTNNYAHLVQMFENYLKFDGTILLASKSYYFGVGGGTHEFSNFVSNKGFEVRSEISNTEGLKREILIIKKIPKLN